MMSQAGTQTVTANSYRKSLTIITKSSILDVAAVLDQASGQISRTVHLSEAIARTWSEKKVVLRNFAEFTGKHLCQSLLFSKVAGLSL